MKLPSIYLVLLTSFIYQIVTIVYSARTRYNPHVTLVSSGSQNVPKIANSGSSVSGAGYRYPVPPKGLTYMSTSSTSTTTKVQPQSTSPRSTVSSSSRSRQSTISEKERIPAASAQQQQVSVTPSLSMMEAIEDETITSSDLTTIMPTTSNGESPVEDVSPEDLMHAHDGESTHHSPQIDTIDVACGKEKMTVRYSFDEPFNGIIYAKGHYSDPSCRFVMPNSGEKVYQFDLTTGQCGVAFIDAGLAEGGQAYVEGMLVSISEPGVQEAWDAARKIRCLWEGNLEQTVTFPLSINMLDQKILTFSGDTASVSLEIQAGEGPKAQPVQGLVKIGDMLTAVVTVQGDSAFDLLVRNCVATDGSSENRVPLSDNRGCATKPKLMGGWVKEKSAGNVLSYAKLSAFKFPDVMDLFLECTVSLCKSTCDECPAAEYLELHIPAHDDEQHDSDENETEKSEEASETINVKVKTKARITKRSPSTVPAPRPPINTNETGGQIFQESLQLRRVVHVIGPDDLPSEFNHLRDSSTIYGSPSPCQSDCFSIVGIISAIITTILLIFLSTTILGIIRRKRKEDHF